MKERAFYFVRGILALNSLLPPYYLRSFKSSSERVIFGTRGLIKRRLPLGVRFHSFAREAVIRIVRLYTTSSILKIEFLLSNFEINQALD
jgi:hypothetical protein